MTAIRRRHPLWVPWFYLAPFILVQIVFTAYPLAQSVLLSTQQTYGPKTSAFVGLSNFRNLADDPLFWTAVTNTLYYTAGSLVIELPLALGIAVLLNQPWVRGRVLFRLVVFSPSLVGMAFVAILFVPIFAKNVGLLNVFLHNIWPRFNPEFGWNEEYVIWGLIVASLWMYTGINMLYFLAALQNVDADLVDAAKIDGAGPWGRFRHVTLPAIWPVMTFVVLLSLIGSFQIFELPFILQNFGGGPDNRGLTIVLYLYQIGFESGDLGYASAIGWCLAVLLVVLAIWHRRLIRRYEV